MSTPTIDEDAPLATFLELTAIPGKSGEESSVAARIIKLLVDAGLDPAWASFDGADRRIGGQATCGNLIVRFPGSGQGPRTFLSAHMDTVPICVGCQPRVESNRVANDAATGLGADDRGGCAILVTAARERLRRGDEHFPPAVLVFFVQEEVGLLGARHLDTTSVGRVDRAFNFDGGKLDKLTLGAIGGERMTIRVHGHSAHAGVSPQDGASAIVICAHAISRLASGGWLGRVDKPDGFGSANVGVIHGGDATNVITPYVELRAEARSHDAIVRMRIVEKIKREFERAADEVRTAEDRPGRVEFESRVDYDSFRLSDEHPSVVAAEMILKSLGRAPFKDVSNGGLDANWLFRHGIEAVTIGCGQRQIHTTDEWLDLSDFRDACELATRLITSREHCA
jgi:tripeptide aminopeptidase